MADTSKPRARRRPSSTAPSGAKGKTAAKAKPKAQNKAPGKAGTTGTKSRRPASSGAVRRRPASPSRKGKGGGKGRGLPGLSLRTLVMGSVAAALVVVGAAIGVTVDKAVRDDPAPTPSAAMAPAPKAGLAPTAAKPVPVVKKAEPKPAPVSGAAAEPPVSTPRVLASSEAQDYAHAAREYEEVPPSNPPLATGASSHVPAPSTKPPVPREHQVAALPALPKAVLQPAPRRFSGDAPWLRNAVPAPPVNGRPMIAVVIDDLGVDKRRSAKIVELDGPLTTAWMTYADNVAAQAKSARTAGHELIIHMPMEPLNPNIDSGPDVLRTSMTADQVRAQVRAGLRRFEGYVGVNNHMGSKFTADSAGMAVVIDEMRANGLLFLDSKTSPGSVGAELAAKAGVPNAERHVFIDNVDEKGAVLKQLAEAERIARRTGYAIAIGHPHDGTIQALRQWLPSLDDKGLVLVPLTAIVRERMGRG